MKARIIFSLAVAITAFQNPVSAQNNAFPGQGNVGIGTTNPNSKLHVKGHVKVDSSMTVADSMRVVGTLKVGANSLIIRDVAGQSDIFTDTQGEPIKIQSNTLNNNTILNYGNTGNVGIGIEHPSTKLHVGGDIIVEGKITVTDVPSEVNPCAQILMLNSNGHLVVEDYTQMAADTSFTLDTCTNPSGPPPFSPYWRLFGNYAGHNYRFIGTIDNKDFSFKTNNTLRMIIKNDGKFGFGTTNPSSFFDFRTSSALDAKFYSTTPSVSRVWAMNTIYSYALGVDGNGKGYIYADINNPIPVMTFDNGGVGIGTTNPTANGHKLAVNGSIRAKKIVVESGWADYVFDDDYKLLTIEEVKEYISLYNHLPGVPSAEEIKAEGVDLAEANRILLEKIEELTLYIIMLKEEQEKIKLSVGN